MGRRPNDENDFWYRVDRDLVNDDACWNWLGSCRVGGYGQMLLNGKMWGAHRLAYTLTTGEIPYGMHVLHTCDNRKCCRPSHLYLGTHTDNMKDREDRNRGAKGERHPNAKLTEVDVRVIRKLYEKGWTQVDLAADFGVHQTQISRIIRRQPATGWAHVE